jgi:hypothetical protein
MFVSPDWTRDPLIGCNTSAPAMTSRRVTAAEELTRRLSLPVFPYVKTGTRAQIERSPGLRLV